MNASLNPDDFIIARKRKKYRFALFANSPLCFEVETWQQPAQLDHLEVGAGTGLFSLAYAEQSSQAHFLAVDVKADRLQVGATLAAERQLSNILFLRARATQLAELLQPASLASIWVTFPDPFPKDRAAKHRLTHPAFLGLYQQLLHRDGSLYMKTDASQLFTWTLEQLVETGWHIEELSFDLHDSTLPEVYKIKTTYEQRYTAEGLAVSFVRATPPQNPTAVRV
jgi:tRNA (guanine-N7-)-methyltransferase